MFSKAKRFEAIAPKSQPKDKKKQDNETQKIKNKSGLKSDMKYKLKNYDAHSQCSSSTTQSVNSFVTPKPVKVSVINSTSSVKNNPATSSIINHSCKKNKPKDDIVTAQEVEIRNKNETIAEYCLQIQELKNEIMVLQKKINGDIETNSTQAMESLNTKLSQVSINQSPEEKHCETNLTLHDNTELINILKNKICLLELQIHSLEQELSNRQVELSSYEEIICIRDSLCKDLQLKLTEMETSLDETKQRLEMVKGHHALALEANESIRKEYKVELETLKTKAEEEKQLIINKCKIEQDNLKSKYLNEIKEINRQNEGEKQDIFEESQRLLLSKDNELKAKLEQIEETTSEKLKLSEIQFEERCRSIQEHWSQQQESLQYLDKETRELKYSLNMTEERNLKLQEELDNLKTKNEVLQGEKMYLDKEVDNLKEEAKLKFIDFENEINRLTVQADKVAKEKIKFEMSLSVTRDIVQVLTTRLRESDNEVEQLELKVQTLTKANQQLENELASHKGSLGNTIMECNEYKEALVNILKSKAILVKEHNRIMEHNVTLIESLQNVEKEAYLELGSIKNGLIEDVEMLKMESNTQIKKLQEEVERKRQLCEAACSHAGQAAAAAEQSRALLALAAADMERLEDDNRRLQLQIQDQQSLVVELSLLRQENEELTVAISKQAFIAETMKKDVEKLNVKPKSPLMHKKSHKVGKENTKLIVSPLRERNHH